MAHFKITADDIAVIDEAKAVCGTVFGSSAFDAIAKVRGHIGDVDYYIEIHIYNVVIGRYSANGDFEAITAEHYRSQGEDRSANMVDSVVHNDCEDFRKAVKSIIR